MIFVCKQLQFSVRTNEFLCCKSFDLQMQFDFGGIWINNLKIRWAWTRVKALHKLNIDTDYSATYYCSWHILHASSMNETYFFLLIFCSGLAQGTIFPLTMEFLFSLSLLVKILVCSLFCNGQPLISSRISALRSLLNASQWLIYDISFPTFWIALWIYQTSDMIHIQENI